MKKLLVLLLVLGLASSASAVLDLGIDGQAAGSTHTMAPSDSITLSVDMGVGLVGGEFSILLSNNQGAMDYSSMTVNSDYMNEVVIPAVGTYYVATSWDFAWGEVAGTSSTAGAIALGGGNISAFNGQLSTLVDGIVFHCEEATDVTITLVSRGLVTTSGSIDAGTTLDSILVHQVPEPATLALLGLGGLLLRKRK